MSRTPTHYSQEQIRTALITYWLEGENAQRAGEITGVPRKTISDWATTTHRELYQDIVRQNAPLLDQRLLRQQEALQIQALETISLGLQQTKAQLEAGEHRHPDQAAHRTAVTYGILSERWLTMQGRPNHILEHVDATQILQSIKQRYDWLVTDAEEITASEQVPESTPKR